MGRPKLDLTKLVSITSRHWHLAKWLTSSEILRWSSSGMFNFALGNLIGPAAVGGIRAVQSLLGLTRIISLGVENVVPSRAAQYLSHQGPAAMVAYLWRFGWVAGLAMLAIFATVAVAPEFWLVLLFGPEYGGLGYVARWLSLVYFLNFFILPLTFGLRAMERGRGIFLANLSSAGFIVVFCYPLVALLGVPGALLCLSVHVGLHLAILIVSFKGHLRSLMA